MGEILSKTYRDLLINSQLTIWDANFSTRVIWILKKNNIETISQLASLKLKDYLKMRNCGAKMTKEIKEKLTEIVKASLNLDICNMNEQIRSLERHVDELKDELKQAKIQWNFFLQPFKDFFKAISYKNNQWK